LFLIQGQASDGFARPFAIDTTTGSIQSVDYGHHEIHAGSHFFYWDAVTLNSSGTQDYLITVPNTTKWPHVIFELDGSSITTFELYEGSDKTGTTLQSTYNNNRNSATTAGMTVHKGTGGGTTDGTLIRKYQGGASQGSARNTSFSRADMETILKQNTKYILRFTSGTSSNLCNCKIIWYEHTNRA
jgi:hypothetical protein